MYLSSIDELKTCPICFENYELKVKKKAPRLLPCKKHSICTECVLKMMKERVESKIKCPFDNQEFEVKFKSIPKNRFILMFLEKIALPRSRSVIINLLNNSDTSSYKFFQLKREDKTSFYGFHLYSKAHTFKYLIDEIEANSLADLAGLKVGHQILEINEKSVIGLTQMDVVDLIQEKQDQVSLLVVYDPASFLDD